MKNHTKASIEQTNKYHTSAAESARRIALLKRKRRDKRAQQEDNH